MNNWKKELKKAFDAPPPQRKSDFIQKMGKMEKKQGLLEFFLSQIKYIQLSTWLVLAVFLGGTLFLARTVIFMSIPNCLWYVSGLVPFWTCILVKEWAKSRENKMLELELACKHSVMQSVLVRFSVLGILETAGLTATILTVGNSSGYGFLQCGLYLTIPFLTSSFLALAIIQRGNQKNETWLCLLTSLLVSVCFLLFIPRYYWLYEQRYLWCWMLAFLVLVICNGSEVVRLKEKMEVRIWNSY